MVTCRRDGCFNKDPPPQCNVKSAVSSLYPLLFSHPSNGCAAGRRNIESLSLFPLVLFLSLFFRYCALANDGGLSPLTSPHWVHPPSLSTPPSVDAPFRFIFHRFGTFFHPSGMCANTRWPYPIKCFSLFARNQWSKINRLIAQRSNFFLFPDPRTVYRIVIPQNSPYPAVPET